MIEQLKEFREVVERESRQRTARNQQEERTEAAITRCVQIMMSRQCIYPNMHAIGPSYRILAKPENQHFFRRFFTAMGLEFYHDTRSGMIALKVPKDGGSRYDYQSGRLRKDETAVLLALRITYEEAFKNKQYSETGHVETSTDDLYDKLKVVGDMEIDAPRLDAILQLLKRKGVVEIGDKDPVENVTPLTILPGIEVVVPQGYILRIIDAMEATKVKVSVAANPEVTSEAAVPSEMAASADESDNTEEFETEESL